MNKQYTYYTNKEFNKWLDSGDYEVLQEQAGQWCNGCENSLCPDGLCYFAMSAYVDNKRNEE